MGNLDFTVWYYNTLPLNKLIYSSELLVPVVVTLIWIITTQYANESYGPVLSNYMLGPLIGITRCTIQLHLRLGDVC